MVAMFPDRMVVMCVLLFALFAPSAAAQPSAGDPFEQAQRLRADGEFDRALQVLTGVIEQATDEDVLRRAHNEVVVTYLFKRNATTDPDEQKALYEEIVHHADAALIRFPDLDASPEHYPAEMNLIYDTRRALLFGSLEVTANVDSCSVFMDDAFRGYTPLRIPYVPVGEYVLTVTHDGYDDRTQDVTVAASSAVQREVALSKHRGTGWWLTRVAAPIVAVGAAVAALVSGGGDNGTPTEAPLPTPPDPPSQ